MIKKALLIMLVFCGLQSIAQRTITGKVTNGDDNEPLVGVTILIEGTTQGTVTDFDGNYSIANVPLNGALRFTYTGFKDKILALTNQNVIDVVMEAGIALDEVVVTALGFSREKKALGYSVTEVDGGNFVQARENNIANALAGRVAGVNVSKTSTGPSGSSRVIIRGNKSLTGNNQPLYVVDGVPMDNSGFGQAGMWGGADEGDGMSSINPDDIETITVLKGANAAALYGARAANGVINIITKRGTKRKGIGVEFNSNYVFEQLNDLSDLQQSYGSGNYTGNTTGNQDGVATKPRTIQEALSWGAVAWGPKFDGSSVIQFDGVSRPYSQTQNKFKAFFKTGNSFTNSLSFTGGNETQSFRLSATDLRGTTIMPNAGFDRTNISLSTNSKFGKRLTLDAKVLYSLENNKNRPSLSDSPANAVQTVWRVPGNVDVTSFAGDPNKLGAVPVSTPASVLSVWGRVPGEELPATDNIFGTQPYWAAYQYINSDKRDRVITSGQLKYNLTDWLYIQGQIGLDKYSRRAKSLVPQGTGYQRGGSITEGIDRVQELNISYTVGIDKRFGVFSLNAFAGGNRMRRMNETINANGSAGFNVPFFPAINNAVQRNYGYGFSQLGINSLLGQVELGYKGFFYLTGTARNDWFSVLNPASNDILYPSAQASLVLTEAFKNLPSFISYAKLRAGWAQVGNATVGAYQTIATYALSGNSHLATALAGFITTGAGGTIPNPGLIPLTSTEFEIGADLRFWHNRIGLDLTYYRQKTTDDILAATISRSSGFDATAVNLGKMQNNGIEALLSVTPIRGNAIWDVSFNIAKNENKVVSLIAGSTELLVEEPRNRNIFIKHIVGYPFGMITGITQKKAPDGRLIFDNFGSPVPTSTFNIIGNGVADWTGGLNNSVTWKNFSASALIDFKIGGDIMSGTNMRLTGAGFSKQSLQGREGEEPLKIEGVTETKDAGGNTVYTPITRTLSPQEAARYWGRTGGDVTAKTELFLFDGSFSKLRQVTIGYSFPKKLLGSSNIQTLQLSFVGRNLAILSKNTPNIDPESGYSNGNGQGLEYFAYPSTRSYGFNLKVGF